MLLVGGYTTTTPAGTKGKARGISAYDFYPNDGRITFQGFAPAIDPTCLLTDRKRSIVYAVRGATAAGGAGVTAHKVSQDKRGKATFQPLSDVALAGDRPDHLAFAGTTLLATCRDNVCVVARRADGSLGEVVQCVVLAGDQPAQASCSLFVPAKNQVLIGDSGNDRLLVYDRADNGTLTARPELSLAFPAGEGPCQLALHPAGDLAVTNGARGGRVHLIDLSGEQPLRANVANALPERVLDAAQGGAIRIGTNGKMVYATDRNFSVVTVLRIDERSKKLTLRDTFPAGGDDPLDLIVSPDGEWLLTANLADATAGVFRIDPRGGLVHYHTFKKVPSPTALAWI